MSKKVIIIGAGSGGLAAAMLLTNQGYDVTIYEREKTVGGRCSSFLHDGFTFDIGPTFLMMPHFLEELFRLSDRNISNYIEITSLNPMYRIKFSDGSEFYPSSYENQTISEIERLFPGEAEGYKRFMSEEQYRYNRVNDCFKVSYDKLTDYLRPLCIEAIGQIAPLGKLYKRLEKYFSDDHLRLAMSFQTKYIGMSPWKAPAVFSLISFIEHKWGVHHVTGGLNKIPAAMAKVVEENGGTIYTSSPVKKILSSNGRVTGILLKNGEEKYCDYIIINSDFAASMKTMLDKSVRKKYTDHYIDKLDYSCSSFMLYLGLNKKYNMPHHNLIFGDEFRKYMDNVTMLHKASSTSFVYIHNPSIIDKSLAPTGKSVVYILVPVPNNKSNINWEAIKNNFRDEVLDFIAARTEMSDIKNNIEMEKILTPFEWERDMGLYNGAIFNIGHSLDQMFYFRPHNRFEDLKGCYLTGGGTHPGSGLPTIILSAIISSELLIRDDTNNGDWNFKKNYL